MLGKSWKKPLKQENTSLIILSIYNYLRNKTQVCSRSEKKNSIKLYNMRIIRNIEQPTSEAYDSLFDTANLNLRNLHSYHVKPPLIPTIMCFSIKS